MKRAIWIGIAVVAVALVILLALTPAINDKSAESVRDTLEDTPLPPDTELIDTVAKAGKLTGNGNGMQFFGAILIESSRSLDELESFYSNYRQNEWEYLVERQEGQAIRQIEHGNLAFTAELAPTENYYIVYSWGNGVEPFAYLDIRGH